MSQAIQLDPQRHRPADARGGFSIPGAVSWSGLSRSALYRYAAEGVLIFRKAGRTTIVDGASLAALVASLPAAQIGGPKPPPDSPSAPRREPAALAA
jgi:hypothetical protein